MQYYGLFLNDMLQNIVIMRPNLFDFSNLSIRRLYPKFAQNDQEEI